MSKCHIIAFNKKTKKFIEGIEEKEIKRLNSKLQNHSENPVPENNLENIKEFEGFKFI